MAKVVRRFRILWTALREDGLPFWIFLWRARAIDGWLGLNDARNLYHVARTGPGQGAIVEIGSAWGRSTVFLAEGARRGQRERVVAIDPHTGDPRWMEHNGIKEHLSFSIFKRNVESVGLADRIEPVVLTSEEAASRIDTGPIRLLFIDGLHTYEGVKTDIDLWVRRVQSGGIVIFDDYYYDSAPDVTRAVDELVASGAVTSPEQVSVHAMVHKI